jgi:hypothetical protein
MGFTLSALFVPTHRTSAAQPDSASGTRQEQGLDVFVLHNALHLPVLCKVRINALERVLDRSDHADVQVDHHFGKQSAIN